MHIPDGLISPALSITGYSLSLGIYLGVLLRSGKQILLNKMTQISLVAAVVFVSSLIHIPMGFTSVHFTFTGLAGVLLGPLSFLAVSLAVFLQWLLLGHGGITTLGVNILNMGGSALAAYFVFYGLNLIMPAKNKHRAAVAILAGIVSALVKVSGGSSFLILSGFPFETFYLLMLSHIPVILGEGAAAGLAAHYILKLFLGGEFHLNGSQKQKGLQSSTTAT